MVKNSMIGMGSLLSVAFLKRDRVMADEAVLPECSDSVTIFKRAKDNREVTFTPKPYY